MASELGERVRIEIVLLIKEQLSYSQTRLDYKTDPAGGHGAKNTVTGAREKGKSGMRSFK